jgi:hypothetical protein
MHQMKWNYFLVWLTLHISYFTRSQKGHWNPTSIEIIGNKKYKTIAKQEEKEIYISDHFGLKYFGVFFIPIIYISFPLYIFSLYHFHYIISIIYLIISFSLCHSHYIILIMSFSLYHSQFPSFLLYISFLLY